MMTLPVFLIAMLAVILIMIFTWLYAVRIENFSIVDAAWSFSFAIQGLLFWFLLEGFTQRKILLLLMLGVWSIRLGYYLAVRISKHHPQEDTRYVKLRSIYGDKYKMRFFIFFMYQALSVSLLTFPFILAMRTTLPQISWVEWFGLAVWILAVIGESIADYQMNSFRSNPANKGKVCEVGLWRYSRHPNYFFESLIWWGFFLVIFGSTGQLWTIYMPLIILFLLLKVTGVPPAEEQSLKNRGEAYRAYQRRTSVFIPLPPKR